MGGKESSSDAVSQGFVFASCRQESSKWLQERLRQAWKVSADNYENAVWSQHNCTFFFNSQETCVMRRAAKISRVPGTVTVYTILANKPA